MSFRTTTTIMTALALALGGGAASADEDGVGDLSFRGEGYTPTADIPGVRVSLPKVFCGEDQILGASFLLTNTSEQEQHIVSGDQDSVLAPGGQMPVNVALEDVPEPDLGGAWTAKADFTVNGAFAGSAFAAAAAGTTCDEVAGFDSVWNEGADVQTRSQLYVKGGAAEGENSAEEGAPLGPRIQTGTVATPGAGRTWMPCHVIAL